VIDCLIDVLDGLLMVLSHAPAVNKRIVDLYSDEVKNSVEGRITMQTRQAIVSEMFGT